MLRGAIIPRLLAVILALAATALAQWNEQVLYSFQGGTDGAIPVGAMVFDKNGNLYGATTSGGGASQSCFGPAGCGTVYELSPPAQNGNPWTETILHVFQGSPNGDGAAPTGGLVMDSAGNLYGVTGYDGSGQCTLFGSVVGCGTVYEMSPPSQSGGAWTETVIYNFQGGKDGYVPQGDLVFDSSGNLYGATLFGGGKGANCDTLYGGNCGTIFELSPPKNKGGAWTEKVLHSFSSAGLWSVFGDGAEPNGGLILDEQGNLYGTTYFGGYASGQCNGGVGGTGCGTVFELVPPGVGGDQWTERVLHRFSIADGVNPAAGLTLANGALYGTTLGGPQDGYGLIFKLHQVSSQVWTNNVLYQFSGKSDGMHPDAPVTIGLNGQVYTTASGGGNSSGGTILQLNPLTGGEGKWGSTVLYGFQSGGGNPSYPYGKLVPDGFGALYGVTQYGGTGQNCGIGLCGAVYRVGSP